MSSASIAAQLVQIAQRGELFQFDGRGYVTIRLGQKCVDGPRATFAVEVPALRRLLSRTLWRECEVVARVDALDDAIHVLQSKALFEDRTHEVGLRIAGDSETVYVDLVNDAWHAVRVTAAGWEIVDEPAVRFVRRPGMQSLPAPVAGGSLHELRSLTNLQDEYAWRLAIAWLVGALRPKGPYPILILNGEQGSAKTTLSRILRALIDPNEAPVRSAPLTERDLMIAATNSRVLAFDNMSYIRPVLSDALCRLATGAATTTRKLYTDGEEKIFAATRPVLINGIEELATRPDLLDRTLSVHLQSIREEGRRDESSLWRTFNEIHPRLLGALLDAVAAALKNVQTVKLAVKPRMADFVQWVTAAEPSLPWPVGGIVDALLQNAESATAIAIEASPVATGIIRLLEEHEPWDGTAADLLQALTKFWQIGDFIQHGTPRTPYGIAQAVRRVIPVLRKVGINVSIGEHRVGKGRDRLIILRRRDEPLSPTTASAGVSPAADVAPSSASNHEIFESDITERSPAPGAEFGASTDEALAGTEDLPVAPRLRERSPIESALRSNCASLAKAIGYPALEVPPSVNIRGGQSMWESFAQNAALDVVAAVSHTIEKLGAPDES